MSGHFSADCHQIVATVGRAIRLIKAGAKERGCNLHHSHSKLRTKYGTDPADHKLVQLSLASKEESAYTCHIMMTYTQGWYN
jgi:hypothetical protein